MAATLQPAHIPVEVYLASSYEPDAEYVSGLIEERSMGEYNHANLQAAVLEFFRAHRAEWAIRAVPELRVQVSANNYRVPDVTLLDRNLPIEQIITHPPVAVIEILSPEDSFSKVLIKLGDYQRMGIENILVLDPDGHHCRYQNGSLLTLTETRFQLKNSAAIFDLAEIEKLLD